MRITRLLVIAVLLIGGTLQAQQPAQPQRIPGIAAGRFKRGLIPTPKWKLAAAPRFVPSKRALPQVAYVPSKLSMWLNDVYGDCVTAEEAFAKACTVGGVPGVFISDAAVKAFASKNDLLNGADLDPVCKLMATAGFSQDGNIYNDGADSLVNFSDESLLQAAITQGPVKIGIDANALPRTAGNQTGWIAVGGKPGQFTNEDHCIGIAGYGPAGWLCQQLHISLPSTLTATQPMYVGYTWSTQGLFDHAWLMSTCGEAWVRNPTTIIVGTGIPTPDPDMNPAPAPTPTPPTPPVPVPPSPTPTPTPTPAPVGTITITTSGPLPAGTVEALPVGTQAAITGTIAALQAVGGGVNPSPAPSPTTIEGRVAALEASNAEIRKALSDLITLVGKTQANVADLTQALGVKK